MILLTLSWRRLLSYRNQSNKSIDWFLYDNGLRPQSSKFQRFLKIFLLLTSIKWPSLVTSWVLVQQMYSKMQPVCTNTHHDVTDLVNHGMVKNTKTWISWELNMNFLRNKKNTSTMPQMTHFEKLSFCSGDNL